MSEGVATGRDLREMFSTGAAWLEKSAADIDAINVFPVPDGDTGTNMVLTMRSTMEEAYRVPDGNAAAVTKAMAYGALMGARGNSGVILSQILRGLAKSLENKQSFNGKDFAAALEEASVMAYKGLSRPVEGTILTVIRDVAAAAVRVAEKAPDNLTAVLEAAVREAQESVARTPTLLPALREAGVVDAGGKGLFIILDGMLRHMKGETVETIAPQKPQPVTATVVLPPRVTVLNEPEEPYGYCTELLIEGKKFDHERIRRRLEAKGQSVIVVGDESNIRIHIHTFDPGLVLHYATSIGVMHQVKVQNMDDQYKEWLEARKQSLPPPEIGIVAVALGDGMIEVFKSLGASAVVSGGQTMNPSVGDILSAVQSLPSNKVIILPNNKNIILTASQIEALTSKKIVVVPTRTMPQGIAAILAYGYEADLEQNVSAMTGMANVVKTVEITRAIRTTQIKGLSIKKGQFIAIVDDEEPIGAGDSLETVTFDAISAAGASTAEVITIYYGAEAKPEEAERIASEMRNRYSGKQIELVRGGQPHYSLTISLE